ncbi:MAG: hypothetical protein K1X72_03455 [Pyrinomonadaceae bacterium]|nr:hypothetical protein [Pyrinomonadaceae bacterium]
MSGIQKFFKKILPVNWAESMEKESSEWNFRCSECGFERSVWESGGIRWKATGETKTKANCASCEKNTWHKIYRKN